MHVPRTTAAVLAVLLTGVAGGAAAPAYGAGENNKGASSPAELTDDDKGASSPAELTDDDKNARPPVVVEVRNPDRELATGAVTTYTITVRNRTGQPLPRTVVTQLLPAPLQHVSSRPRARASGRQVVWQLPLPAHGIRSMTMTGRVGEFAEEDLAAGRVVQAASRPDAKAGGAAHLSTTVCVRAADRGQLLTCSTASAPVTLPFWRANRAFMAVSATAALVIGVVGVVLLRRRRPLTPPAL